MSEISQEELDTLSPEEREAFDAPLQPGDDTLVAVADDPVKTETPTPEAPVSDVVIDAVTEPGGETDAATETEAGNETSGEARQAAPEQAPTQADPTPPAPAAPATEQPAPAPAAVVPPTAEQVLVAAGLPEDHADQLKRVEADLDSLAVKMDEDEVSYAEYSKGTRDLSDKRTELIAQRRDAETAVEVAKVSRDAAWTEAVVGYLAAKTEFHNEVMHDALQSTLNRLYVDPAYQGKTNEELLEAAGSIVVAATGVKTPAPAPKSQAAAAARKVANAVKGAANEIPFTLGEIPAADGEHIGDNEFGGMDKLTGMAAEKALEAMTPAQQARYGDTRTLHG